MSGLLHRIRNRGGGAAGTSRKKPKTDKQHRIQIRWLHYDEDKNKYVPVRSRHGGGNRYITYMDSEPLTLQQIQHRACELFFPKGKSHFGLLQDMSRVVANSSGDVVHSFPGCGTIADYLNENGLYPSLTYLYLRTICVISEEDELQNVLTQTPSPSTSVVASTDNHARLDFESDEDLCAGDTSPLTQYTATSEVSISTTTFPPFNYTRNFAIIQYSRVQNSLLQMLLYQPSWIVSDANRMRSTMLH